LILSNCALQPSVGGPHQTAPLSPQVMIMLSFPSCVPICIIKKRYGLTTRFSSRSAWSFST